MEALDLAAGLRVVGPRGEVLDAQFAEDHLQGGASAAAGGGGEDGAALRNMDVKRHSDIVDAIESGDAEKAAATVRDHMAGAAAVFVDGAA